VVGVRECRTLAETPENIKTRGDPSMTWRLVSVHERNKETPYTFYIPSNQLIEKLMVGDQVKLIFESDEEHENYSGERMWVEITVNSDSEYEGILTNQPVYISDLNMGEVIKFRTEHICDTLYEDPEIARWNYYFDYKVIVSKDVLERREFNFMIRDNPNNKFDTGWTFFTGYEQEESNADSSNFHVVSLGAVLNMDDSILQFINEEPLCAYERDLVTNEIYKVEDYDWKAYLAEN
jgi:hypothetical protein